MSFLDEALAYAARGWPVFPLQQKGKHPVIASAHPEGDPLRGTCNGECGREGHGLYDATTNEEQINRWWAKHPKANIGLRTGIAFDVIDIDSSSAYTELLRIAGNQEGPCAPVATTGKGWHYYVLPTGAGNRAAIINGVDYRGQGGYVVAPPSVHPDGRTYQWEPCAECGAAGPDEALENLPAWFARLMEKPKRESTGPTPRITTPEGVTNYIRSAFTAELEAVEAAPQGVRNHTLNRAAFNLGTFIGAGLLDRQAVGEALHAVALARGLSDGEARATITSGLENGIRAPRQVPVT